jgi:predicted extracellular nuclease
VSSNSVPIAAGLAAAALVLFAHPAGAKPVPLSITSIQGAAHLSPLLADTVVTRGIVTGVSSDGFYLQDPSGDDDPATSDAVFVFTGQAPAVTVGDEVDVEGVISEFLPGNDPANLTVTEIHRPAVVVVGAGRALPAPVRLGPDGRRTPRAVIDDDALTRYEPDRDGIDFYESLEGMRVLVAAPRAVQATNAFGEVWVVPEGTSGTSARGALAALPGDLHPQRVQLDDVLLGAPMPAFEVGDVLADVTGVVSYRFGSYEVLAESPPAHGAQRLSREIDSVPRGGARLRVASFNARNLGPDDGERRDEIARVIVSHLGAPEIVGLEEIQDGSGPDDDGVVDATATLRQLVEAIRLADGPAYDFREVAPADGADGGAPGGNIRVALLFDPARVSFVDRGAPSAATETRAARAGSRAQLTRSPGRVAPDHSAWIQSRKPLAGEFLVGGETIFVVVAHFTSQSRSTPCFGALQPPVDPDAGKRRTQAQLVVDFVRELLAIDDGARVVVLGDLNDDWFSTTLATLESAPLFNLMRTLPPEERYSLFFDGAAQLFDHVLVSESLRPGAVADVVHVAAEFASGVSDHDPVIVSVRIEAARPAGPLVLSDPRPNPFSSTVELDIEAMGRRGLAGVFEVRGERVRTIHLEAGDDRVRWDGCDDAGRRLPAGVYWIVVGPGGVEGTRKVVFMPRS